MVEVVQAMKGFKLGCDPELFVMDDRDRFVSAEGLIPGTKEEPFKVDKGAVQVDGMAAEFNTDPAETFGDFNTNVSTVLEQLKAMLPKGYKLVGVPAVNFDEDVWADTPDNAKVLGCSPDYNAWTGTVNPPPKDVLNPRLRTASGHLHYGWTEGAEVSDLQHLTNCRDLAKQLDFYLGAWSLSQDDDSTRRRLYGKAGAIRVKDYGVEYRVLSNFWVLDERLRLAIWNRSHTAIHNMKDGFLPDNAGTSFNKALVQSIDDSCRNNYVEDMFKFPIRTLEQGKSKHILSKA
jgi:hypothetical protein